MPAEVKVKKRCCGSDPRCKRCPGVLKRLERSGHAEKLKGRRYRLAVKPPAKVLRRARKR
jgi:hypothetical protein